LVQSNGVSAAGRARFKEGFVEADGFRIRFLEAGQGEPLVVLHGGGGLRLYRSHELLSERRRVFLFEVPGFGASPANERTRSMAELAGTMAAAIAQLGIQSFDLQGNSFGGKLALWLAALHPERVRALVLIAPAAIRAEPAQPRPAGERGPDTLRLYAHPERVGPLPSPNADQTAKQMALVRRIIGLPQDEELESRMRELTLPVLVLFGTLDTMLPSEIGRRYPEILPSSHLVFVYDAAHEVDADRPEACAGLIDDFLERHGGFLVNAQSSLVHP
jgi:pimeloyl-ACP methyl ester carboxylesterase